jgi:single-strand DNA-binding protein
MASLNRVLLIGNLTRDPELRYTPSGTAVADLGIAVNREWTDREGEKRSDTCFVDIVAWQKQAEFCERYLTKGSLVFVEGRLQLDTWETPQGEKRSKHRVVARTVQILGGRGREGRSPPSEEKGTEMPTTSAPGPEEEDTGMPF